MRRLLFLCFTLVPFAVYAAACDPDLGIVTTAGDAGTEGGKAGPSVTPQDDAGDGDAADDAGDEGGTTDAGKTHQVDGINDFAAGEKLATTSSSTGYQAYFAFDAKNLYFGMEGADVAAPGAADHWVMIYLGSPSISPAHNVGIAYDCSAQCAAQQPGLPFAASYHLRWKTDASYTDVEKWNGTKWDPVTIAFTVVRKGTFVEMSVSQASIGSPNELDVDMNMLIEKDPAQTNGGWTYAGVPSTSFTDAWNPTFTKYYAFDLTNPAKAPNTYTPQ